MRKIKTWVLKAFFSIYLLLEASKKKKKQSFVFVLQKAKEKF
jgi:hypothetical protein